MLRRTLLTSLFLIAALPAFAQQKCDLQMSVDCQTDVHGNLNCTSTTVNNHGSCSGLMFSGWFSSQSPEVVKISTPQTSKHFEDCLSSDDFADLGGQAFAFCYGSGSFGPGSTLVSQVRISGASVDSPIVAMTWIGSEDGASEYGFAYAYINGTALTCTPIIAAPPVVASGVEYQVSWGPVSDHSAQFIVEESTTPDFTSNVTTRQVNGLSTTFLHDNMATTTTYYYRVKPTNCAGGTPEYSRVAQTVVKAEATASVENAEVTLPLGSTTPVEFQIFIPPPSGKSGATTTFNASMDKPFLGVNPKSGTFPAQGLTLTITARPESLPPGASTGTLTVVTDTVVQGTAGAAATTTLNVPVSVSLVTPVTPGAKTLPPPNTLIIPVVTHVNGGAGPFLSDVRLTNAGGAPQNYQVTLAPTQTDATKSSKITMVTVAPQQTIALNDIVKNFFGLGVTTNPNDTGFGSLEIRPLSSSSPLNFASSRTYASTVGGTFGQFIAAVPFTKFASKRIFGAPLPGVPPATQSTVLSMQQVAHSSKFRTNLGIVEGAGEPASGRIRVFNSAGTLLKEVPFSLLPGEHRQMNRFIEVNAGIPTLDDGRLEVVVDSPTGAVSAYASVLDNITTDPLAVMPVDASKVSSTRYVIPGMAELPNRVDNFHSDVRVFNGGTSAVTATLQYFPQGEGTPSAPVQRSIAPNAVLAVDNVLPSLFNLSNTGGSLVITTPANSSLVTTGRTYTLMDNGGTFGQFIPGVTPAESIGLGNRALQVLQLEQSDRFRSNLGIAEVSGNPVTVRVSLLTPDSLATPSVTMNLGPNQFRQDRIIEQFLGPGVQVYNARVTVEVIGGTGKVTAYGSVIDNESKDPTYVPAQ